MNIHFRLWYILPYMGEASGSQPVPDPLRFMGRFNENAWVMGTFIDICIFMSVSLEMTPIR